MRVLLLFIIINQVMLTSAAHNATYDDVDKLVRYLFDEKRYNKDVRPILNQSHPIQVNISGSIAGLYKMLVSDERGVISALIDMAWTDQLLTWDPSQFNGIDVIALPRDVFWNPEMQTHLTHHDFDEFRSAWLTSSGVIRTTTSAGFSMMCTVDNTYFPIDKHDCHWSTFSQKFNAWEVIIHVVEFKLVDLDVRSINNEWMIDFENIIVVNSVVTSPIHPTNISVSILLANFIVQRRGLFIIVSIICPGILITLLNILTCFIPANSGERLSFSVTVLLALAFFTIALMDDLPPTSLNMPLLSYVFVVFNGINAVTVLWSVVMVNVANKPNDGRNMPQFFRRLWSTPKRKITKALETSHNNGNVERKLKADGMDSRTHDNSISLINDGHIQRSEHKIDVICSRHQCDTNHSERQHDGLVNGRREGYESELAVAGRLSWEQVAVNLDRCYFWTILVTLIVFIAFIWGYLYPKGLEKTVKPM